MPPPKLWPPALPCGMPPGRGVVRMLRIMSAAALPWPVVVPGWGKPGGVPFDPGCIGYGETPPICEFTAAPGCPGSVWPGYPDCPGLAGCDPVTAPPPTKEPPPPTKEPPPPTMELLEFEALPGAFIMPPAIPGVTCCAGNPCCPGNVMTGCPKEGCPACPVTGGTATRCPRTGCPATGCPVLGSMAPGTGVCPPDGSPPGVPWPVTLPGMVALAPSLGRRRSRALGTPPPWV